MNRSPASVRSFRRLLLPGALLALSGALAATQILEVGSFTLTSYKAAKTIVQDCRPLDEQRGVSLDGSLREGSTFALAVAGNPFERAWRGDWKHNGVQLDTGTWSPTEVDLALPAPGHRWLIGRTYNARQDNSGQYDSDGYQGYNWFQTSQPEIRLYDDADNTQDVLYLVWGANRYAEYQRTGASSLVYKGKNGAAGCFLYTSGSPDTWALTDQVGTVFTFFGFNTASNQANGQIWKIEDTAGNKSYVGDATTASTAVTNGFYSDGRLSKAYDTDDQRYTYSYTSVDGTNRLTEVKAETKTGGTWASPTGVAEVGKVEYGYYSSSDSNGDSGDLRKVTVTLPLSDSGVSEVRVQYYRYYEGTYNASTNPGYPHQVKLFLDWEGARNFDYADSTFDGDFLTETTDNLKPYAAAYFEYDTSHRVSKAWFSGQCGCGGAGTGTHTYRYETNGSYTDNSGYDTAWARRTSIDGPDAKWTTQYFDETGQPLSRLFTDADPANTNPAPGKWVDNVARDSTGIVTSVGTPASVATYTHSTGAITSNSSSGLIWVYVRDASGDDTGFLVDRKYKKGSSGTEYLDRTYTWDVTTAIREIGSGTGIYVRRPLRTGDRVYSQAITSGTTGSYNTTWAYTTYSGATPTQPLAIEKITQTDPAVATGNNGSGTSTAVATHLRKDGLPDFVAKTNGSARVITYSAYTNGQVTTSTQDANTTSLSPPTDFSHLGTPIDGATTQTFDGQGRPMNTTLPGGRVTRNYYSKLADRRLVTLTYPKYVSGTGTFYGPVGYTVSNHAGQAEVQGTIALTGNESTAAQTTHIDEADADPITGVDTGTSFGSVAQMRTYHFDEAGTTLEEERAYFSIPSAEPGTEGTHYDPTKYGYDDMGRRRRVKEAHGTITRTVFDTLGRVTASWIGTNDSSFAGGEAGTDNMVKVSETEFDSNADDGNSLVTSHTLFIQDNTTGERETTFQHDVRGNVLLATNPQSPHLFYKPDNMDRVIAVGGFSSTGSIVVGTDDPTTETTNRVSLSQTFFDEMGQVWKQQRHKITQSTGADADNLQVLSWFDPLGRLVKQKGQQFTKTAYDRLDRTTHEFVLANTNDTVYADADDVSGDVVLVESQTTFELGGNVLMQARIDRLHDDYGAGQTTGALDTNADSDALKYTATNLEGRIQIMASWYDDFDRLQDRVAYGTNGGSDINRSGLSVPARSDTALRSTYTYNTDGTLKEIEDPKALKTRHEYDALGRRTKLIANYTDGTPGGGPYGEQDQTVAYAFTDGLQTSITADQPSGETDQVTTYIYSTKKGTPSASKLATEHMLRAVKYPDSTNTGTTSTDIDTDSSDVVSFAYNAQGQQVYKKDQAGNVFEIDFDTAGRETHQRVTTLASGFDGAVRRISTTYNSIGDPDLITQYDDATVGAPDTIVDEFKYSFDSWGYVSKLEQDRNSAVGASGSIDDYEASYTWAKVTSGANTLRVSNLTCPSGTVISFDYRSATGLHDADVPRVTQLQAGGTALVTYKYNGLDTVVGITLDEPDVMSNLHGSTSGSYPDLDRFNRITTSRWTKDLATDKDFYKVDAAYDRNSNFTSADDGVHAGHDVKYTIDDINRLVRAEEGTLSGGSISSRTRDQHWTLTQAGNLDFDKVDLNGDGDFVDSGELNDDRTHNSVNELTARDTDDNGTDNYTLTYDAAGNLTDDGKDYKYEWDPFGRLRKVKNRTSNALIAEYRYNGGQLRIGTHEDTDMDGDLDSNDKWYYFAYDRIWRLAAVFREGDASPKEEFVYHAAGYEGVGSGSFIDLALFRDKDANTPWTDASDGTLEERSYYCGDRRPDVVALVSSTGTMKEWVKYSAYGVPFGLPGGDTDSDGDCDSTDVNQIQTWINASAYDVRGDIDLDGDVDSTDRGTVQGQFYGIVMGRGNLSSSSVRNSKGSTFSVWSGPGQSSYARRYRSLNVGLGNWLSRDPIGYFDGPNLYRALGSNPVRYIDPQGLACHDTTFFTYPPPSIFGPFHTPRSSPFLSTVKLSPTVSVEWTLSEEQFFENHPFANNCLGCGWHLQTNYLPMYAIKGDVPCPTWFNKSGRVKCLQIPSGECNMTCGILVNLLYKMWHGENCVGQCGGAGGTPFPTWTGPGTGHCAGSSYCQPVIFNFIPPASATCPVNHQVIWTLTGPPPGVFSFQLKVARVRRFTGS